jgi:nitrite reductase/ring-hydroxylating ferredoxin subunit
MRFVRVAAKDEIPDQGVLQGRANGCVVALVRCGDEVFAVDDVCTHEEWSLSDGFVDIVKGEPVLVCALHGAEFCPRTGRVVSEPAERDVRTYPVRLEAGEVLIGLDE